MIARCTKVVVNYNKHVLFKPQSSQRLQQQIKLSFFFAAVCGVLSRGKRRGCNNKKKINFSYVCM